MTIPFNEGDSPTSARATSGTGTCGSHAARTRRTNAALPSNCSARSSVWATPSSASMVSSARPSSQRRILQHANFPGAEELHCAVVDFMGEWNSHEAHPFNWTFRGRFVHTRPCLAA